jgi:hypothetical protein
MKGADSKLKCEIVLNIDLAFALTSQNTVEAKYTFMEANFLLQSYNSNLHFSNMTEMK